MASIKTLLTARLVSLFLSFAFTICVVGLSGKCESTQTRGVSAARDPAPPADGVAPADSSPLQPSP